ncbi:MAG: hypothetical protein LUD19_06355 [Clostridia bacterium]|nr:hypothetical protein [Clostridia bacterium]
MGKEYLLTEVENVGGLELEHTVVVTQYPEKIKTYLKAYVKPYYQVCIYERTVTDWKKTEPDKISSSE